MATAVHSCWISRRAISPTSLWGSRTEGSVEVRAAQVESAALALHLAAAVFQSCAARRTVVGRVGSLCLLFRHGCCRRLFLVAHRPHSRPYFPLLDAQFRHPSANPPCVLLL